MWYVFAIMICWAFTWLSFRLIKNKKLASAVLTLLVIAYALTIRVLKAESHWYSTVLCYPAGVWFYLYREEIEKLILGKHKWVWYFTVSVLFILFVLMYLFDYVANGKSVLFALFLVVLTMKVKIGNRVLRWLGSHVFSIFILQRLPMILFTHLQIHESPYLFFFLSAGVTLLLAVAFDSVWARLDPKFRYKT